MSDLNIACSCGTFSARIVDVSPRHILNRGVCYCHDCQSFAYYLGHEADSLDERGGTHLYHVAPWRLLIEQGKDKLAVLRMSEKGPLRWFASCCKTPIGNTLSSRAISFAGMIERPGQFSEDEQAALGETHGSIYPECARPGPDPLLEKANLLAMAARLLSDTLAGLLTGRYRQNPFFNADGTPVVEPTVLDPEERATLLARVADS